MWQSLSLRLNWRTSRRKSGTQKGDVVMKKLVKSAVVTRALCVLIAGAVALAVVQAQVVYGADAVCEQIAFQPFDLLDPDKVDEE